MTSVLWRNVNAPQRTHLVAPLQESRNQGSDDASVRMAASDATLKVLQQQLDGVDALATTMRQDTAIAAAKRVDSAVAALHDMHRTHIAALVARADEALAAAGLPT